MPNRFNGLAGDSRDSVGKGKEEMGIPSHEDLSLTRVDEETVLTAVYGDDFWKRSGAWGSTVLCVKVKPPDTDPIKIGSQLTLSVHPGKKYPYLPPVIEFHDVKGLGISEQAELRQQLIARSKELASIGSVMVCELVQLTEDYLYSHNKDPTMSAYDQMKVREEEERKMKLEKERTLHSFMNITDENSSPSRKIDDSQHSKGPRHTDVIESAKIRKELDRQQAALMRASEEEKSHREESSLAHRLDFSFDEDEDDDNDDDNYQLVKSLEKGVTSSRYKSDFIELGELGRGGGGTVFKVRNRLDRRIYAVKKVKLQSEQGKMQQFGRLENMKLRREVTTISRMTHRHIVRYYQAWVEGGDVTDDEGGGGVRGGHTSESPDDEAQSEIRSLPASETSTSSQNQSSGRGFWGKKPSSATNFDHTSDSNSNFSWSSDRLDDDDDNHLESASLHGKQNLHQLESDEDLSFVGTPLIRGLGFENRSYSDLFKRARKESVASSDDLDFQSSSVHETSAQKIQGTQSIMYIQMEYCSTTLRQLIDEEKIDKMEKNECWKMIRQTLEALAYIHKRKVIHRDLKPANIFLDVENNIRLGDFGLATTRNKKSEMSPSMISSNNVTIQDTHHNNQRISLDSAEMPEETDDTITGGVGTTFYIAPEQACRNYSTGKGHTDYDMKADIFSLGVVIFEMFYPFATKMERATILQRLRGDDQSHARKQVSTTFADVSTRKAIIDTDEWKVQATARFPKNFCDTAPVEIQKLILWCLERSPDRRPSAEQLLASDLIPRQMELDHRYLEEALQTIANPESESHEHIMKALFDRHSMQHVEITYDTDDVAKMQRKIRLNSTKYGIQRPLHPIDLLAKSLDQIGGFTSRDLQDIRSSAMSFLSMSAATSTLRRAKGAGKIAKGEVLRIAAQHASSVLAMTSATAAAGSGHINGVNGADPRVIKTICDFLEYIFETHGGIPIEPPLLRPKNQLDSNKTKLKSKISPDQLDSAEVINERGNNLLLPEDLQVNFARAVGRGGGALSNIKRYMIGKSYLKSISGGHPREVLEASLDIVLEDHGSKNEFFTAETVKVVCEAFRILSTRPGANVYGVNSGIIRPIWFLRLTHTRLTDAILDLCGVPLKESTRQACYHILTRCSAPPPCLLSTISGEGKRCHRGKTQFANPKKILSELIDAAITESGLLVAAAGKLRAFLNAGCLPLPLDVGAAIDALQEGIKKLRSMDDQKHMVPKRQKRYEDVARALRSLRNFLTAMEAMGISSNDSYDINSQNHHHPSFISIDLGLRQPTQHYHGHQYYQAIMLTEDPHSVTSNDTLLIEGGKGIKIAEGGRYDDLVRRFRPPGNFGSSQLDQYTSAPIPVCTGVRIMIGAFVERIYVEAALESRKELEQTSALTTDSKVLRRVLAIPYLSRPSVQCIVVGMNGFDTTCLPERAMVASHLWSNGISAEYVAHSGVLLSLLRKTGVDSASADANDWTLDQLCDMCCILRIPFVVVVQQHLLRERNSVRLRHIVDTTSAGIHEIFLPLASLTSEIKDRLYGATSVRANPDFHGCLPNFTFDWQCPAVSSRETGMTRGRSTSTVTPDPEYIYVDADQFYMNLDKATGKDPKLKPLLKQMKKTQLKANPFVKEELHNILAVDLPFPVLREFNSEAMFSKGHSIVSATTDFLNKHPKHRKTLKTLAMCLDFLLRRTEDNYSKSNDDSSHGKQAMLSTLVYSQPDDRFDLLTLEAFRITRLQGSKANDPMGSTSKTGKHGRNGRR